MEDVTSISAVTGLSQPWRLSRRSSLKCEELRMAELSMPQGKGIKTESHKQENTHYTAPVHRIPINPGRVHKGPIGYQVLGTDPSTGQPSGVHVTVLAATNTSSINALGYPSKLKREKLHQVLFIPQESILVPSQLAITDGRWTDKWVSDP